MDAPAFSDRLIAAVAARGPLCVGLDPHPAKLPAVFGAPSPEAFETFFNAVVDGVAGKIGVVKPQIALFERWGPEGLAALARIVSRTREAGLLVLLDAKRGDIGSTAQGYAEAYLGPEAWLAADAVTVNPYMGLDTLTPWIDVAKANGRGVVVLLRTSNPGAADLQDLNVDGRPVWTRLAQLLRPLSDTWVGEAGWSSLMVVVGATAPEEARQARELLPLAPFLVPGYGAQGASAADALAGGVQGPTGREGVLVNASRSVLYPDGAADAETIDDWRTAFDANLARVLAEF